MQGIKNVQQEPALWIPVSHHGAVRQWRSCLFVRKQCLWERPIRGGWGELWAAATWQREASEEHLQRENGGYYLPDQRYSGGWHLKQHCFTVPLLSKSACLCLVHTVACVSPHPCLLLHAIICDPQLLQFLVIAHNKIFVLKCFTEQWEYKINKNGHAMCVNLVIEYIVTDTDPV